MKTIKQQSGLVLIMALVFIVVVGLLSLYLSKLISTSSVSQAQSFQARSAFWVNRTSAGFSKYYVKSNDECNILISKIIDYTEPGLTPGQSDITCNESTPASTNVKVYSFAPLKSHIDNYNTLLYANVRQDYKFYTQEDFSCLKAEFLLPWYDPVGLPSQWWTNLKIKFTNNCSEDVELSNINFIINLNNIYDLQLPIIQYELNYIINTPTHGHLTLFIRKDNFWNDNARGPIKCEILSIFEFKCEATFSTDPWQWWIPGVPIVISQNDTFETDIGGVISWSGPFKDYQSEMNDLLDTDITKN